MFIGVITAPTLEAAIATAIVITVCALVIYALFSSSVRLLPNHLHTTNGNTSIFLGVGRQPRRSSHLIIESMPASHAVANAPFSLPSQRGMSGVPLRTGVGSARTNPLPGKPPVSVHTQGEPPRHTGTGHQHAQVGSMTTTHATATTTYHGPPAGVVPAAPLRAVVGSAKKRQLPGAPT